MSIPKHIIDKITESNTILDYNYQDGAYFSYSLAMEELKPILEAARDFLLENPPSEKGLKLFDLLKQYDEQHK